MGYDIWSSTSVRALRLFILSLFHVQCIESMYLVRCSSVHVFFGVCCAENSLSQLHTYVTTSWPYPCQAFALTFKFLRCNSVCAAHWHLVLLTSSMCMTNTNSTFSSLPHVGTSEGSSTVRTTNCTSQFCVTSNLIAIKLATPSILHGM